MGACSAGVVVVPRGVEASAEAAPPRHISREREAPVAGDVRAVASAQSDSTLAARDPMGPSPPAPKVFSQQGSKLVGAGAVGTISARQGVSVSLSADGHTTLVGGLNDNNANGAAWVFVASGPGDFDGDGKTDRTIFRPSTGAWCSLLSGGSGTATSPRSTPSRPSAGERPATSRLPGMWTAMGRPTSWSSAQAPARGLRSSPRGVAPPWGSARPATSPSGACLARRNASYFYGFFSSYGAPVPEEPTKSVRPSERVMFPPLATSEPFLAR